MFISKFSDFINEKIYDSPHGYLKMRLSQIEKKLHDIFDQQSTEDEEIDSFSKKEIQDTKETGKMVFSDLPIKEFSIEKSNYSQSRPYVKVRFFDDSYMYDLFVFLELKDGVAKDQNKDFKLEDIKDCYVEFKKYDQENPAKMSVLPKRTVEIDKLSSDLLIELKLEIDKSSPQSDEQEFKIETE